jgi:hypothetical protein
MWGYEVGESVSDDPPAVIFNFVVGVKGDLHSKLVGTGDTC